MCDDRAQQKKRLQGNINYLVFNQIQWKTG